MRVVAVYPSSATLPENQLRFYLHFSAPMSRGEVYQHLQLLDQDGKPIVLPFLEIGEELWDTTGQRLTLLIDPGRIKRGLCRASSLAPCWKPAAAIRWSSIPPGGRRRPAARGKV